MLNKESFNLFIYFFFAIVLGDSISFYQLDKVCINLKIYSGENFSMEVWSKPFFCLLITNQLMKYNFEFLKDWNIADSDTINKINKIDILIGFNFYRSLVTGSVEMG